MVKVLLFLKDVDYLELDKEITKVPFLSELVDNGSIVKEIEEKVENGIYSYIYDVNYKDKLYRFKELVDTTKEKQIYKKMLVLEVTH